MKLLIVEDEAVAAERITNLVRTHVPDAEILGRCDSIEETVAYLKQHPMPELMLMDIELADGKSFEIFDEVKVTCPVIITTAYDEYVLKAFGVHSVDYLLKPIQADALKRSIEKFRELQSVYAGKTTPSAADLVKELRRAMNEGAAQQREHFLVKNGHRLLSISAGDIAYFYSENGVSFLKTHAGNFYTLDETMDDLEQQVDGKAFHRCSRKFLVARSAIQNAHMGFNGKINVNVKPAPSEDIVVSRDRAPEFKKWMGG